MATVLTRDVAHAPAPVRAAKPSVAQRWYSEKRLTGLSRFAIAITVLNVLGHTWLGFEQAWITPFVALAATYGTDLLGETIEARMQGRAARYRGSFGALVTFLLPAHISGLAVGMLLYAVDNFAAIAFAGAVAMSSKYVFRAVVGTNAQGRPQTRHYLNPSNFGITVTLLLFPTVGIAPPYMFAENTSGILDWLLPCLVIVTGSLLNTKATGRIPLILAWLGAFAAQAVLRGLWHGTPIEAGLVPMTGFAFVLFTFYMITDPATTPAGRRGQILFAVAVAALYGVMMELHVVFGLFYALTLVTAARGLALALEHRRRAR
ncbi:enediyne biosynthesis protein UnbU [Salinarimonas sp.]|uniref:enediyne biosynthesis protein UnbU n=1 Tax=Salinarimonas sp. TaxID=2766526 RepID=UPI0032D95244